jgi:hypothetical protein
MTRRHNVIVIGIAFIISAAILVITFSRQHPTKQQPVSAKIFQGPNGWGYDIWVRDTLFIHQEFIPAIAAKKGFSEKIQADKAASLVLQKMKQDKLPTLTKLDIDHICAPGN